MHSVLSIPSPQFLVVVTARLVKAHNGGFLQHLLKRRICWLRLPYDLQYNVPYRSLTHVYREHLGHKWDQPFVRNTLYDIQACHDGSYVTVEHNLISTFVRHIDFVAASADANLLVVAVFCHYGSHCRQINNLADIIEFLFNIWQVKSALATETDSAFLYHIRNCDQFL